MQKIMFNDKFGLTKAVLEGRKTQTRRFIPNNHQVKTFTAPIISDDNFIKKYDAKIIGQDINPQSKQLEVKISYFSPSARYQGVNARVTGIQQIPVQYLPEETVAVAQDYETVKKEYIDKVFRCHGKTGRDILDNGMEACKTCENPDYCLDKYASVCASPGWQNKMFVKADLMLHQIRITGIHLERLQDISDEDCIKEGIKKSWWMDASGKQLYGFGEHDDRYTSPREAYAALIDKVSGKGTWDKNPWVFVYDFTLEK